MQNEEPLTRTMKLGVPALTKNLQTEQKDRNKRVKEVHVKQITLNTVDKYIP